MNTEFNKINLNRLYYFYLVVRCKSITLAAQQAGIDQSGMSRHMMALEKEVGETLLNRTRDGVTTTRKGGELYICTEKMMQELHAGKRQLSEDEEIAGKIRISTTHAILNYILGQHLINFNKIYPDIHLDIICDDYAMDLIENDVDVAVRLYDSETPNIIQEPLFKLQAKLYASKEYIQKNGMPETAEDLSKHKFIAWSRPYQLPFNIPVAWFLSIERCTTQRNCIMNVNSIEMLYRAAQDGIGIISSYDNMEINKNSNLIQVAPMVMGPEQQDYFIYSEQMKNCKRIILLKNYLRKVL